MKPALSLNARRPSKLMPLFAAAALTAAAGCSPGPAGSVPPPAYSSTAGSRAPAAPASSAPVPPGDFCADTDQDRSCDDGSGFIDAAETATYYGGAVPYYRRSSGDLAGRSPAASQPSKPAPGSAVESKAPAAPAVPAPETTKRAGTFTKSGDGAAVPASGSAAGGGSAPPAQAAAGKGSTAGTEASGGAGTGGTGTPSGSGAAAGGGSAGTSAPPRSSSQGSGSLGSSPGGSASSPAAGSSSSGSRGGVGSSSSGSSG